MRKPILLELHRRIVTYLDGLYPGGLLRDRHAKVNTLREWWSSRASAILACIETQSAGGEELRPFFGPLRALMLSTSGKKC